MYLLGNYIPMLYVVKAYVVDADGLPTVAPAEFFVEHGLRGRIGSVAVVAEGYDYD